MWGGLSGGHGAGWLPFTQAALALSRGWGWHLSDWMEEVLPASEKHLSVNKLTLKGGLSGESALLHNVLQKCAIWSFACDPLLSKHSCPCAPLISAFPGSLSGEPTPPREGHLCCGRGSICYELCPRKRPP